jgi:hypothetical protein
MNLTFSVGILFLAKPTVALQAKSAAALLATLPNFSFVASKVCSILFILFYNLPKSYLPK